MRRKICRDFVSRRRASLCDAIFAFVHLSLNRLSFIGSDKHDQTHTAYMRKAIIRPQHYIIQSPILHASQFFLGASIDDVFAISSCPTIFTAPSGSSLLYKNSPCNAAVLTELTRPYCSTRSRNKALLLPSGSSGA
jgi:hypothetical protein